MDKSPRHRASLGAQKPTATPPTRDRAPKIVSPWTVALFGILTVGIYFWVFWWRVSKEVDRHLGHGFDFLRGPSHPLVKRAFKVLVATWVLGLLVAAVVALSQVSDGQAPAAGDDSSEDSRLVSAGFEAFVVLLAGSWIVTLILAWGQARALIHIKDSRSRAQIRPVNATVFVTWSLGSQFAGWAVLAGWKAGPVIAVIAALGLLAMMAMTQANLNAFWQRGLRSMPPGTSSGAGQLAP